MKHPSIFLSLALINLATLCGAQSAQQDALQSSTQMMVVTTTDWNTVEGVLVRYERTPIRKKWKQIGDPITVVVGKKGMGWGAGAVSTDSAHDPQDPIKREGDGKSPAGAFALGTSFGYAPQSASGLKMPYLALIPSVECVDDSASQFYNRVLDRATVSPDWHSSEQMLRNDEAYRVGLVVEHNQHDDQSKHAAVPGGGSCIFMHIWYGRGQGTTGCTAMPQEQIESILAWLDPARNPLLVQLPAAQYKKLQRPWHLPKLPNSSAR